MQMEKSLDNDLFFKSPKGLRKIRESWQFMTLSSRVPEFILEEKSEKTFQEWDRSKTSNLTSLDQAVAKSRELSKGLAILVATLEEIQDLLHELVLWRQEPE